MSIKQKDNFYSIESIDNTVELSKVLFEVVMMALNSGVSVSNVHDMICLAKSNVESLMNRTTDRDIISYSCYGISNSIN